MEKTCRDVRHRVLIRVSEGRIPGLNVEKVGKVCYFCEPQVDDTRVSKRYIRGVGHLGGIPYIW